MDERAWGRDRVTELTAVLTAVSLALVFGAALQLIPVGALPQPEPVLDAIPHVNVALSLAAIGTILAGWRSIRRGDVGTHRRLMIASFLLFAAFLLLYLYRVAVEGPTSFDGPALVRNYVYVPILVVHVLLAVVCVPFVFYALLLGSTRSVPEIYETTHARVGQIAASLWLVSFSMGIVIYALLYLLY